MLHHVTYHLIVTVYTVIQCRFCPPDFHTGMAKLGNHEHRNLMVSKPHSPVFDGHWRIHVYPLTQTHLRVAPPDRFPY